MSMLSSTRRRDFLKAMALVAALTVPRGLDARERNPQETPEGRPNILVICSDEHHPLMSGYRNHPIVKTPNLDQLAADGAAFTRAYCNSPLCGPSRMSFISGKYVHNNKIWTIGAPLDRNEMTWARRLDQAGIPSTMLGKLDFCGPYQDGGFTEHRNLTHRPMFDPYPLPAPYPARLLGYLRKDKKQHLIHAGTRQDIVTDGLDYRERVGFYDHDRIVTGWATEYLKEKGKQETKRPWALYVGLLYPHWPFCVPRKFFDMYYPDNIRMPHDARFPNPHLHPCLQFCQKAMGLDGGDIDDDMLRRTIAAYYGMITCMDEMAGRIISELKKQGLYENTYIIYTTDHGESLGEHGLFYKQCSYEGSVGVPLIVKGPGLGRGRKIDHPVTLVDMYPTIMEMAGLQTEDDRDGVSWLPLISGEDHKRPDYAFSEFHGNFLRRDWYMLVRGNYKYTYYDKDRPSLFNIRTDPQENYDLATDPSYEQVLQDFKKLLRTVCDPEEVSRLAKKDLGLIGPDGTDYTETLTVQQMQQLQSQGKMPGIGTAR